VLRVRCENSVIADLQRILRAQFESVTAAESQRSALGDHRAVCGSAQPPHRDRAAISE